MADDALRSTNTHVSFNAFSEQFGRHHFDSVDSGFCSCNTTLFQTPRIEKIRLNSSNCGIEGANLLSHKIERKPHETGSRNPGRQPYINEGVCLGREEIV